MGKAPTPVTPDLTPQPGEVPGEPTTPPQDAPQPDTTAKAFIS